MAYDPGFDLERPQQEQSNVLAIVGFILAFCTGPIGMLVSLIACRKEPRGLAIAGVIVGLLTTVIGGCLGYGSYMAWKFAGKPTMTLMHATMIQQALDQHQQANNGTYPESLDTLSLSADQRNDGWGSPMTYTRSEDGKGWKLVAPGADLKLDTADDMKFDSTMNQTQMKRVMEDAMEGEMKRQGIK